MISVKVLAYLFLKCFVEYIIALVLRCLLIDSIWIRFVNLFNWGENMDVVGETWTYLEASAK